VDRRGRCRLSGLALLLSGLVGGIRGASLTSINFCSLPSRIAALDLCYVARSRRGGGGRVLYMCSTRAHEGTREKLAPERRHINKIFVYSPACVSAHLPHLYTGAYSATATEYIFSNEKSSSEGAQQALSHKHMSSPSTATSRLAYRLC
jgi:hypothetical protein